LLCSTWVQRGLRGIFRHVTWYRVVSRGHRYDRRDPAALGAQFTLDVVEQVYNAHLNTMKTFIVTRQKQAN
jgi:hypothetical protein